MLEAIYRGKALLREELAKRVKAEKEPRVVWSKDVEVDIVLAIWNRTSGTISLATAKKSGKKIKILTPGAPPIEVTKAGGIYSEYEVKTGGPDTVVGVIYPVFSEIKVKKKKGYVLRETVYTPYNRAFFTPEVLAAGSNYLSFLIQDAFDDMRAKGVKSRAFPDKLLADVVEPYLIKSVIVTEHTSPATLVNGDPERAIGRFLIELAVNKDDAFDLALSRAGAAGLVQFIPSTYNLMVKRWPELKLITDFKAAMADHKNAVKAQTALLDANLAAMPAEIRTHYKVSAASAGELMAAAYNGGATRIKRAVDFWGDTWSADHAKQLAALNGQAAALKSKIASLKKQLKKLQKDKEIKATKNALAKAEKERSDVLTKITAAKKATLRNETFWYVAKIRKAYGMFTAGAFATPEAPSGGLPAVAIPAVAVSTSKTAPQPVPPTTNQNPPAGLICFDEGGCAAMQ